MAKRVLVVDDDAAVREVVVETIRDAGYECVEAADGFDALRMTHLRTPDLIILDALMPRMSGDEVHEALRRDPATRYVPVIFLSAQGEPEHKVRRLDMDRQCQHVVGLVAFTLAVVAVGHE